MMKISKSKVDNLPSSSLEFKGRKREVKEIERALADPDINIITIYGVAGIGKTSLALFVAKRQRKNFPGGVIWINCRENDSLSKILTTMAQVLNLDLTSSPSRTLRDVIVPYLHSNPTLLIFDDYELVAEDDKVLSFVGRLPRPTKALITSRVRIRVPGRGIMLHLGSLTKNETTELLKRYLSSDQWEKMEPESIQAIYQQTSGLPLAVVFVVGLLRQGQSLPHILGEIQKIPVKIDMTAEHILQQMETNLSAKERQFLSALSVFVHPVDGEVVATISEIKNWQSIVESLTPRLIVDIVNGQYTLHPLLRTYFRNKIDPKQLLKLEKRMVGHFLTYSKKFLNDFNQLDREWPNIQHSIDTAYQNKFWHEFILFVLAIGPFAEARGYENDYKRWLSYAIEVSERQKDEQIRAALLHILGVWYQQQGEFSAAMENYEKCLQIYRKSRDQAGEASTLAQLGNLHFLKMNLDQAVKLYYRALEISRNIGNSQVERDVLGNLGLIAMDTNQYDEAEKLLKEALSINREIGDRRGESRVLTNLGVLAMETNRYDEAEKFLKEALSINREIGDRRGESRILASLGSLSMNIRRYDEAEKFLKEALSINREIGDRHTMARVLTNLGVLAMETNRYIKAEKFLKEALSINREIGDRRGESRILASLGSLSMNIRRYDEAEKFLKKALSINREIGDQRAVANTLANLGALYRILPSDDRDENFRQAIEHYSQALEAFSRHSDSYEYAAIYTDLGNTFASLSSGDRNKNLRQAIDCYKRALTIYTKERFPREWLEATIDLVFVYANTREWEEAKHLASEVLQTFKDAIADQKSLDAVISWYEQLGDLAIDNRDLEFAIRIFAEIAHLLEFQEAGIPNSIQSKLAELQKRVGDDRFVIILGEVQGAITPNLAQTLLDAMQYTEQEKFEQAEKEFSEALQILSELVDTQQRKQQRATILFHKGFCLRKQELWEAALSDLKEAFHIFERLRDFAGEARVLLEMGHIYGVMNNFEEARLHYMDAYRLYRRANDKLGMAIASENLGKLEFGVRMLPQAIQDLEEAKKLYTQLGEHSAAAATESYLEDAKASLDYQKLKAERRGKQK